MLSLGMKSEKFWHSEDQIAKRQLRLAIECKEIQSSVPLSASDSCRFANSLRVAPNFLCPFPIDNTRNLKQQGYCLFYSTPDLSFKTGPGQHQYKAYIGYL